MLLIRADASVPMGTGHIMRCLALAQAWQMLGGKAGFACSELTEKLKARLEADNWPVYHIPFPKGSLEDAEATSQLAHELSAEWTIVDGYQFGSDFQDKLKSLGHKLLFVDDYGQCDHYSADLILNQNFGAHAGLYSNCSQETELILGSRYALLRQEFLASEYRRTIATQQPKRILVTLGGSDPDNVTSLVIAAINAVDHESLDVQVVVGGSSPHLQAIREAIDGSRHDIRLVHDVKDMSILIDWAEFAICAGGSSNWEMCHAGLPRIVLCLADNQQDNCRQLALAGAAIYAGSLPHISVPAITEHLLECLNSRDTLQNMSIVNHALVDGRGAERVCRRLREQSDCDNIAPSTFKPLLRLRKADEQDLMLLLKWANDSDVRKYSFTESTIELEEHKRWFKAQLSRKSSWIFLAEDEDSHPVGQIRFEFDGSLNEAVVGTSIDRDYRAKGFGREVIRLGMEKISQEVSWRKIVAKIRITNERSLHAFLSNDFRIEETILEHPTPHWILCRKNPSNPAEK